MSLRSILAWQHKGSTNPGEKKDKRPGGLGRLSEDGGVAVTLDDRTSGDVPPNVSSIPLSDPKARPGGDPSIGTLVRDATAHLSTLFRAEVALAKAELTTEAKKAAVGAGLILVALTVALYASLFFFWFLGELLSEWLPRWAAFGIVFLILLIAAIITGLIGYKVFKRMTGPTKTIDSVHHLSDVLPGGHDDAQVRPGADLRKSSQPYRG
jgi:hypothetical protein